MSRQSRTTTTHRWSALALILMTAAPIHAFVVVKKQLPAPSATRLSMTVSSDRIKKAGAGIPVVEPGSRLLFDPNLEGMKSDDSLNERLAMGSNYVLSPSPDYLPTTRPTAAASSDVTLLDAQHWLEDIGLPLNFAKPQAPVTATVLGRTSLLQDQSGAIGNIQHVILKLPPGMHYVEGQSISVIPPGFQANGKPHKPRLYSIASTRYGDAGDGQTVSLCVRQAEYVDPQTGLVDATKAGVCSTFLCNLNKGDAVQVAGPIGKTMLLPEEPTSDIIMVATGTGIAPFRAFWQRLFVEETVAKHLFAGQMWLIFGVPTSGGILYQSELEYLAQQDQFRLDLAVSREMQNVHGGKLYVQDVLAQNADELFAKLEGGAHIYFCGLKGMMPGILEALEQVAASKGLDWKTKMAQYQANHQWHVEVY